MKLLNKYLFLILLFIILFFSKSNAQDTYPIYITGGVPINEYNLFANSGWDGNWYIGYNMCWIKKLPTEEIPKYEEFSRAFVGVKIGRSKLEQKPGKSPWDKEIIKGKIYVGISSTPSWTSSQRYFLCNTQDIPTEGDWENAITTTGEAKWFYVEVPINEINPENDIWICVFSDSPNLCSVSSAPVLAGGWRERKQKDTLVWLNNEITGSPPININNSLKTPIRAFDPAIILKLIPADAENQSVNINVKNIIDGRKDTDEKVFFIKSQTPNIERVWMEISIDNKTWERFSNFLYTQPYSFSISINSIPQNINGDFYIRFAAADIFENIGHTNEIQLNIKRTQTTESSPEKPSKIKKR